MTRCRGITKAGTRCKREINDSEESDQVYCYTHRVEDEEFYPIDTVLEFKNPEAPSEDPNIPLVLECIFQNPPKPSLACSSPFTEISDISESPPDSFSESGEDLLLSTILKESPDPCYICSTFNVEYLCKANLCVNIFEGKPKIIDVRGDGYCFWRSLAVAIFDDEHQYRQLLDCCMINKEPDDHISRTYVEFYEIPLIAKFIKRKISIYAVLEGKMCIYTCFPDGNIENIVSSDRVRIRPQEIHIAFTHNHYQAIKNG
jgi:hypothetical protein